MATNARWARKLARHQELLRFEREAWSRGETVAGLDEAGAGPLAGPVVAGCVVLEPAGAEALVGVDDSKRLSPEQRDAMAQLIQEHAVAWATAEATVEEIDALNVLVAAKLAMRRAMEKVRASTPKLDALLIDARTLPDVVLPQTALVKGDARSLSIAAASILAKVTRDRSMIASAHQFPGYGFEQHKGYGTAAHVEAIRRLGVTPIHRRTFEPIKSLLGMPGLAQ